MTTASARPPGQDARALAFAAEMYGLQIDLLARLLGASVRQARAVVTRWARLGLADSGALSTGPPWVWLTRAGLLACGASYRVAPPALPRLAHLRAVTAARIALEAAPAFQAAAGYWRSERHLRARLSGRLGVRDHLPDAEIHWPDLPAGTAAAGTVAPGAVPPGAVPAWAGECWAVEAELTPKTVARTIAIMRELLARTGDYGCPASEARQAGLPPRHARALYLCSPAATPTVLRARESLGSLAGRIEVRALPADAYLPAPAGG